MPKFHVEFNIKVDNMCEARQILNLFYAWMVSEINYDYREVKEKIDKQEEYVYLIEPFKKNKKVVEEYKDKYQKEIIFMEDRQTRELENYLEHTKMKHGKIKSISHSKKNIKHYNRMLSWYAKTPKNVDCVVGVLSKTSFMDYEKFSKESFIDFSSQIISNSNKSNKNIKRKYQTNIELNRRLKYDL